MNTIESANMPIAKFASALSRYNNSEVVYYQMPNRKVIAFNTYKKQQIRTTEADMFAVVTPGQEYRPDLVSYKVYGTTDFWWKIMEANNIKDIFEFKAGTNLRLPGNVF